jgi:hypothetical protein
VAANSAGETPALPDMVYCQVGIARYVRIDERLLAFELDADYPCCIAIYTFFFQYGI